MCSDCWKMAALAEIGTFQFLGRNSVCSDRIARIFRLNFFAVSIPRSEFGVF